MLVYVLTYHRVYNNTSIQKNIPCQIRSEESIDIKPYLHDRKIDKVILPLDKPLSHLKQIFLTDVSVILIFCSNYFLCNKPT